MAIQQTILEAIDRSVSHNEIVRVTVEASRKEVLNVISPIDEYDGYDFDFVMTTSHDGSDVLDIWAAHPDAVDGEMTWRLEIQLDSIEEVS